MNYCFAGKRSVAELLRELLHRPRLKHTEETGVRPSSGVRDTERSSIQIQDRSCNLVRIGGYVVGPAFVLDYKSDSKVHPEEHRFQLWTYARALEKSEAVIAYLRHDVLHRFDKEQLDQLDAAVEAY